MDSREKLRHLPKADVVMEMPPMQGAIASMGRKTTLDAVRKAVEDMRFAALKGEDPDMSAQAAAEAALAILSEKDRTSLRRVINATGIVLHTNLGRARLCEAAAEAAASAARSYSTLEYDADKGERGSRHSHVEGIISEVTGAEAAMAVNNNAAATLLTLVALARHREVLVSRGELVEIGGSFRVPEIMEQGGTVLREVGTTNKTRLSDYEKAAGDSTAAILKVHPSNYRVVGFTESTPARELAELARSRGLVFIYDLGSGLMEDLRPFGLDEPTVRGALADGADLVLFSGDKLLGGPQAGIIVGKKRYVDIIKAHQLARALRVDKMTVAALEATFRLYRDGDSALKKVPVLSMVTRPEAAVREECMLLASSLRQAGIGEDTALISVEEDVARVGGGAAPMLDIKSWCVSIRAKRMEAGQLQTALRRRSVPVIARVSEGALLIQTRTMTPKEADEACKAVVDILSGGN